MADVGSSVLGGASTGAAIGSVIPGIGTAIGAGAGALIGGIGSIFGTSNSNKNTRKNMRYQTDLNKEQMAYNDNLNRQYQEFLWQRQMQAQVSGMKNAGINPSQVNPSLSGATASNAVHSGATGPSAPVPDIVGGMSAGASAMLDLEQKRANIDLTKAQARQANSTATGQDIENSATFVDLRRRGYEASIAENVARAEQEHTQASLNTQKVAESCKYVEKLAHEIDATDAERDYMVQRTIDVNYQIAERVQNMSESRSREALNRANIQVSNALAGLHKQATRGLEISNNDLERVYNARNAITVPVYDSDGKPTGHYRSYWGSQAAMESTEQQIAVDILDYQIDMLKTLSPEARQKYLMTLDAGQMATGALNAVSNARNAFGGHSQTIHREYHSGGYIQRTTSD